MKIAVVTWIVNDVGGINSWTENFVMGLKRLNHQVQIYYGSFQRKLNCDPNVKVNRGRFHLLPAKLLSYSEQDVKASVAELNGYDLIIFAHPSPHPTKSNTECKNPRGWQHFYTDTKPFKAAIFHDRHWDRTNDWIAEVRDHVGYAHAAQHHFINNVKKFAGNDVKCGWGLFPLWLPSSMPDGARENRFILATQWLALKNHSKLVPKLLDLKVPLHSYGGGQVYHKLAPIMKQTYGIDRHTGKPVVCNPKSPHIHFGHIEYRQLINAMLKARFSLDMSIQGMTNMTHWEPMTVGTISVMEKRVQADPFCEIPEDCCLTFDLNNIIDDLNRIAATPVKKLQGIQSKAWDFVQRCDCELVTAQILKQCK